jgi:hypothetical protein
MELFHRPSFERLTGLAFFTPSGGSGAIPWGNIQMMKLDHGLKMRDYTISVRGVLQLRKRKVYGRVPIYSIQGDQFSSQATPILLGGERAAVDHSQLATGSTTFSFTAAMGRGFRLPHVGATIASVKVGSDLKTLGYDYFVDDPAIDQTPFSHTGYIILPQSAGTIVAGNLVSAIYSAPAFTLEEYVAFSNLQTDGALVVLCEDEFGPPALWEWIMDVTVYCKASPDVQEDKFRVHNIEAAVYGEPIVRRRSSPYPLAEIALGDHSILDLS